jgi:hypothetical protein
MEVRDLRCVVDSHSTCALLHLAIRDAIRKRGLQKRESRVPIRGSRSLQVKYCCTGHVLKVIIVASVQC